MTRRSPSVLAVACTAALLLSATACGTAGSITSARDSGKASQNASGTPTASAFGGEEIPDLQGRWWTWAASQPTATNPVRDRTGVHCAVGQSDDVWFVAGTFGGVAKRACTVPAGRPIAGPLLNLVCSDREQCEEFIAAAEGEVTLDGAPVDIRKFEAQPIRYTGVAGNPVTQQRGRFTGLGCGLWFTLPGLQPGVHKLSIDGASGGLELSVEYTLTVTA
ncbi:signal protein [Yinghuangia soli]|uniref:Signal protein n=1 Tax=Yinghuangia soli TaxID=2908204 RepID=A0AA41Q339_9ACTN|nr:signal protein [Yinghuangia soli]MCF2530658.1 signal protein [Yinghuangia soli]